MFVFLPEMLRQVLVRASGNLRQQAILPLLQQLEDKERGPQMPLIYLFMYFIN